jgi:serine/threonine-protein kinase
MSLKNIKDLENGILNCESCGAPMPLSEHQALSLSKCLKCSAVNFIPMRIGVYWLFKPLGGGGMGRVYMATDSESGEDYAVKLLHNVKDGSKTGSEPNNQLLENLMREARAGKALESHKNIVQVVGYGQIGSDFFIVTKYVSGNRLDDIIRQKGFFSEDEAIEIIMQVLEAEIHILSKGYFYRDIKPENIIVEENGNVKIYDYGVCLPAAEAAAGTGHMGEIEGSPFYLPPERVVGAPEGEYSEIYSLGMLLFHMLAGRTYYSEADIKELVSKHVVSLRIMSVATQLTHCSPATVAVIDKMIKRKPNDRYHSFADLKKDLEDLCLKFKETKKADIVKDVSALPPEALSKRLKEKKKKLARLLIILGAVLTFAVCGYFAYASVQKSKLKKKIISETAAALGVSPDVSLPQKTEFEIKTLITQTLENELKNKISALSNFDENKARTAAMQSLGLSYIIKPSKNLSAAENDIRKEKNALIEKEKVALNRIFDESKTRAESISRINLSAPVKKPEISIEDAKKNFEQYISDKVSEKYPAKELAARLNAAYKENEGFRIGQLVQTVDAAGLPVKGHFLGRSGNKIKIGDREILNNDIPEEERWKFDEGICEKRVAKVSAKIKDNFNQGKKQYAEELKLKEETYFYKNLGYLMDAKKKPVSIEEVIKNELLAAKNAFEKHLREQEEEIKQRIERNFDSHSYYKKSGYCELDGKWMPHEDAVAKIANNARKSFENEKQKKIFSAREESRKEIEIRIYKSNNYVFYDGKWLPAKPLLDSMTEKKLNNIR